MVLFVNAPTTHIDCPGINFPIAPTPATQKNYFRSICVIILGLIVQIRTENGPPNPVIFMKIPRIQ